MTQRTQIGVRLQPEGFVDIEAARNQRLDGPAYLTAWIGHPPDVGRFVMDKSARDFIAEIQILPCVKNESMPTDIHCR